MPARPRHRRLPIGRSGGRAGRARRWAGSPRSCFEFELGDHRILWGTIERLTLQPCNPANPAPTAPGMRTQAAKSFLEKPWHCLVARDCAQYQECSPPNQPQDTRAVVKQTGKGSRVETPKLCRIHSSDRETETGLRVKHSKLCSGKWHERAGPAGPAGHGGRRSTGFSVLWNLRLPQAPPRPVCA